ncbi:MAG: hypothetical protein PHC51_11975 [bacterium]|nr:hypothetical protein [bacterium]
MRVFCYRGIVWFISSFLLSFFAAVNQVKAAPVIVDTSMSSLATMGGAASNRKTFYDDVSQVHWVAYYNGSAIEFSYTDNIQDGIWQSAGTLAHDNSEFSLTYKTVAGVPYVIVVTVANTYDIVLRRGVIAAASITFGPEVTVLDGNSDDDTYSAPSIAVDGNDRLWVAAVWDFTADSTSDKVVRVRQTTNSLSGDIGVLEPASTLGKADQQRNGLSLLAKGGGHMYLLSGQSSNNLETWEYDGSSWIARNMGGDMSWFGFEGSPVVGTVFAAAVGGTDLYVGGWSGIYRFDGVNWSPLGLGVNGTVRAIATSGTDVYVGGSFGLAGGVPNTGGMARWDGITWHALETGPNGSVYSIFVSGSDIYAGGWFTDAGGNPNADNIARWDGASWNSLGTGLNNPVNSVVVSGANVYVAGDFTDAGGNIAADYIAVYDGASWGDIGGGVNASAKAVAVSGTDVYFGGSFSNVGGNPSADYIARWDGGSWNALGSGTNGTVNAIHISGGDVYVGGSFNSAGGVANTLRIAGWNGVSWSAVGTGRPYTVHAITELGGNIYCGRWSISTGDQDTISRWDGLSWSSVGSNMILSPKC